MKASQFKELIKEGRVEDLDLPFDVSPPEKNNFDPKKRNGRPFGEKDSVKRKTKVVRPQTKAFVYRLE